MKYDKITGKRIRPASDFTTCRDCGSRVVKSWANRNSPKRCRKCLSIFYINNPGECPSYKTGRNKTAHGYITVAAKWHPYSQKTNGRIYEHRLVAEKTLGRYLKANEIVHHLNGIKDDNRPENLVVCQSDKEHRTHHIFRSPCMICGGPHDGRGFCIKHFKQWRRRGYPPDGICVNGKWFKPLPKTFNKH